MHSELSLSTQSSSESLDERHSFTNLFENSTEMVISGHRGGFMPENTLGAFRQAKHHQLQAIELDVSFKIIAHLFIDLANLWWPAGGNPWREKRRDATYHWTWRLSPCLCLWFDSGGSPNALRKNQRVPEKSRVPVFSASVLQGRVRCLYSYPRLSFSPPGEASSS